MSDPIPTTNRDRPAHQPVGCECVGCGCVFVGEEWHVLCRVCDEQVMGTGQGRPECQEDADAQ